MQLKKLFPVLLCLICSLAASAQDRIFKSNGEVIDAKISVINGDIIVFRRFDNLDGPEYSIPKADVVKIKYVNGTEDIFEGNNDRIGVAHGRENFRPHNEYARNRSIIAFAPIQFTEHGWGIGVNWEHSLDPAGWVSVNVPAVLSFNFANGNQTRDAMFYFTPGIKVYTNLNSPNRNKFSIGPSLVFGMGTGTPTYYNQYATTDPPLHQSRMMMSALASIGGNLFPTPFLYLGADIGMGFSYINEFNGVENNTAFLLQSGLKIGYRYEGHARSGR